jgi:hypothetical protein
VFETCQGAASRQRPHLHAAGRLLYARLLQEAIREERSSVQRKQWRPGVRPWDVTLDT